MEGDKAAAATPSHPPKESAVGNPHHHPRPPSSHDDSLDPPPGTVPRAAATASSSSSSSPLGGGAGGRKDLLSELPDDVLRKMALFLDLDSTIHCGMLAKRWTTVLNDKVSKWRRRGQASFSICFFICGLVVG